MRGRVVVDRCLERRLPLSYGVKEMRRESNSAGRSLSVMGKRIQDKWGEPKYVARRLLFVERKVCGLV